MRLKRERRSCQRRVVSGTAAILNFGYLGQVYELEDLSHMGARLKGPHEVPEGGFKLLLRISKHFWERNARLAWDDRGGAGCLGIEFVAQDALRSLDWSLLPLVASAENEAWASQQLTRTALLVLDHESRQSPALFQSILALGLAPIVVSTPLEAITIMERNSAAIEIVFMTESVSGCHSGELARFVADEYPDIQIVVLAAGMSRRAHFPTKRARQPTPRPLSTSGLVGPCEERLPMPQELAETL